MMEEILKALQSGQIDMAEAQKRINALNATKGSLSAKVSPKGALSVYGLGRWPVSLYRSQWERLGKWVKDGKLDAALEQFKGQLAVKEAA
jgi:hypothetical protein